MGVPGPSVCERLKYEVKGQGRRSRSIFATYLPIKWNVCDITVNKVNNQVLTFLGLNENEKKKKKKNMLKP